jgi:translocation and assembly module TamB
VLAIVGERGDGRLNGAVTVNNQTQTVQADAELTATGVVLDRRAPDPVDLAVSGALNGAAARARVTAVSRGGLQAEATFAGPLTWTDAGVTIAPGQSGAVDWRVVGAVDALWAAFGPLDQRVSGAIEGQGRIALTATGWSGEGAARLSNAMLHDSLTGLRLRDGAATVRFNDAGAVIEALSARGVDGGSVNGAGAASGPQAGALSLTLERLRVLDRPDIDATASGSVSFSWAPQTGAIAAGALRLDEVNAAPPRPARLQSLAPVREINRPVARDVTTVAAADRPVRLDLGLTAPGRVFVRGRGLQSEWALDLAVRGDTAHPDLIGQARLLRGDFQLAGRVFTLERGQVQFVGAPGDAVMDIEAERATADLTAMVRVAGTVATPQISVASTPALPREEVLPRILFGRTVADLSPLEAAELAGGLAALSGDTAFDLAGAARALVQLDRLDVRSMEGGFALTGGKYLTPEVYLEVARTSLGGSQAALEWQVRPRLFLVSRFNPQGDARVSIRWRGEDAAPPKPPG